MERQANQLSPTEYANPPNGDDSLSSNLINQPFVTSPSEPQT